MSGRRFSIAQMPKDPTEEAFVATWELTLELHAAGGYAPLDTEKATKAVYGVMCEGMTWLARAPDGTPVGTLALTGVGIPHMFGFAGFHSKDAIIETAFAADGLRGWLLGGAALTISLSWWRLSQAAKR